MSTRYFWLHIPTGGRGEDEWIRPTSRGGMLELVNRWNAQQPGTWQYWL